MSERLKTATGSADAASATGDPAGRRAVAAGPLLEARGLDVARDGRILLRGVDVTLRAGEVVAILGPNGVGKSTLLATLAGLLPLGGGVIQTRGRVAAALQAPVMARRSVQANVEAALGWWGVPRGDRAGRATAALRLMRAERLAERLATELSGGEARRVHLARALALEPAVLLLDEPFAGLDPLARAELLADAGRALRDPSRSTLVVLHDRAEAWALADRLIVILDSGIAADGAPGTLLEQPPTLAVAAFLGFTGRITERGGAVRCMRPAHVAIASSRDGGVGGVGRHQAAMLFDGVVRRRVPEEDGVLCDVDVDGGQVQVRAEHPGPALGERVRLRIDGGVRFPTTATAEWSDENGEPSTPGTNSGATAPRVSEGDRP